MPKMGNMGSPACYEGNSVKFSLPLVDERFVYFEISIEFSKYFLVFKKNR